MTLTFKEWVESKFPPDPVCKPIPNLTLWAMESAWNAALASADEYLNDRPDGPPLLRDLGSTEFTDKIAREGV